MTAHNALVQPSQGNGVHAEKPSDDLTLAWRNINYFVDLRKNRKQQILYDVSGTTKTGCVTAIMGSSGSGKTTLLGAIARKIEGFQGTILLNGRCVDADFMKQVSAFLPQHEIAIDCLTAFEHMQFVCALKLSPVFNGEERNNLITKLLLKLSLEQCSNTEISKLSGGEKKRLFLAAELLTDPSIVLCDEPTTGLDSFNATRVVQVLSELADNGKIVLASVHQPSTDIFNMFTHVLLLSRGHLVFHGTLQHVSTFFNQFDLECPANFNPAEFYVKQISVLPESEELCLTKVKAMSEKFSQIHILSQEECNEYVYAKKRKKCSVVTQLVWLLWRAAIEYKRQIRHQLTHVLVVMITAVIIAAAYSASKTDNSSTIQDTNGILYLTVSELMFTSTYSVLNTFPQEIPVILREKDLYSALPYYVVKTCALIPAMISFPAIFVLTIFLVYEFSGGLLLLLSMTAVLIIASSTAMAYGLMMSALFESSDYMTLFIVPLDHILMLMTGIFINVKTLPYLISWLNYISHFYYAFELISILQWENVESIACADMNIPCTKNGTEVLEKAGFSSANFEMDIGALILIATLMHICGLIGIIRRRKNYSPL